MTVRRAAPLVILLLALAGVAFWYFTRPEPTDEQKIQALINEARVAVERKNVSGLMRLISEDYLDKYGNDKRGLQRLVIAGAHSAEQYTVFPQVTNLKVKGDLAYLEMKTWLWVGDPATAPGQELNITAKLLREGKRWRVLSSYGWEEAEGGVMND